MAAADLISWGIGSPASIRAFILDGLSTNAGASDTTPDAFSGETKTGQALGATVTFTTFTPTGYDAATTISIAGDASSEYSIDLGAYTSSPGSLSPGQSVTVRHTASGSYNTNVASAITIGGEIGLFASRTIGDPASTAYLYAPFGFSWWRF